MTENICFWNHWNNKNIGNTLSNKKGEEMNIYDLEIRLEELESKLYEVVCLAKDIEREARHFGGEIGRVVGGQLDSYFISWMNAFIENKHQPGSIASLRNYLTREREERREEDGDR